MTYKRGYSNTKSDDASSSSSDDTVIELDAKKQITVRKFNNINLVDIREFYIDKATNEKKPGKKGISLTEELWHKLIDSREEVERGLDKLNGKEDQNKKVKTDAVKSAELDDSKTSEGLGGVAVARVDTDGATSNESEA